MKTKQEIAKILQDKIGTISCNTCKSWEVSNENYPCDNCDYYSNWVLSTEKALEIAEKILE